MYLEGTLIQLLARVHREFEDIPPLPGGVKMQMLPYQMGALFGLAREMGKKFRKSRILEIGTGFGSSTIFLSLAAPEAVITSLTMSAEEGEIAKKNLRACGCGDNVDVRATKSTNYLKVSSPHRFYSLIWVDGDHNRIREDMPWFNRVRIGGLFLCHDYSDNAGNQVKLELNRFRDKLGREFDVYLKDTNGIGMAGFFRQKGDRWSEG